MKKLIALLLLVACVCVGTIGCGGDTGKANTGGAKPADTSKDKK